MIFKIKLTLIYLLTREIRKTLLNFNYAEICFLAIITFNYTTNILCYTFFDYITFI